MRTSHPRPWVCRRKQCLLGRRPRGTVVETWLVPGGPRCVGGDDTPVVESEGKRTVCAKWFLPGGPWTPPPRAVYKRWKAKCEGPRAPVGPKFPVGPCRRPRWWRAKGKGAVCDKWFLTGGPWTPFPRALYKRRLQCWVHESIPHLTS